VVHLMSKSIANLKELSVAIANQEAVFFIGAGLSAISGAPTWEDLIYPLKKALSPPTKESNPLLIAQFFRNQHGDHKLFSHLRSVLSSAKLYPSNAHDILCSLPINVFFTTNYDCLLESTFRMLGRSTHVITNDKELALWDENREVQLVKIHGDLDHTSSIVLTEEDYDRFLQQNAGIQRKLIEIFTYRTVIFVGYSLRDPNISLIYNKVHCELGGLKRKAYMFSFEEDYHILKEWERRGIHVISIPINDQSKAESLTDALVSLQYEVNSLSAPAQCDVLIVEDSEIQRISAKHFLLDAMPELRIECAEDGLEASMLMGKIKPRLIWVDIRMPRMDGFEFIEFVRRIDELKDTKIMIVSAFCDPEYVTRATGLNVHDYIVKPYEHTELIVKVAELLSYDTSKEHYQRRISSDHRT
jgi:CheY-like chemotaxis protein